MQMPCVDHLFSTGSPERALYDGVCRAILAEFPDVSIVAHKTQVTFSNPRGFAFVWPARSAAQRRAHHIGYTLGLPYRLCHPRVVQSVEPYPGRFTHHFTLTDVGDIDAQLMAWTQEAFHFARAK